MLKEWAKFAGFAAILGAALAFGILWALDYIPQNSEWTCKSESTTNQPNSNIESSVVCHLTQAQNLHNQTATTDRNSASDFFESVKITDVLLAVFTGLLVVVGAGQCFLLHQQARLVKAVESPFPLVNAIKLVQFAQIPGENVVTDPVLDGLIPANCRIHIAVENKGKSPLKMVEMCVEKFAGIALPTTPIYTNRRPWNFVLEKGPIWLRPDDPQSLISLAEIAAAATAFQNGGAFWVYGYFAYRTLLDERVEHKFLVRWDFGSGFLADNRPDYT
jgi:hypothetical protein